MFSVFSLVSLSGGMVSFTDAQTDRDVKHEYLKCILLTLKELSAVIAMKVCKICYSSPELFCSKHH